MMLSMVASLVYLIFGLIELLIAARFVLLLIGANPTSSLVAGIYSWSSPFVAPFANIFGQHITVAGSGAVATSVFDWTALVALIVYAVIGGLLARVLSNI
jgi:hypothetical protein